MTQENFIALQTASAKARRLFSKKKKDGWRGFCESLSPRSSASLVWKNVKRYRRSVDQESASTNDPSPWLDAFLDKLAPPFVPNEDCFLNQRTVVPTSTEQFNQPFSSQELQCVLSGLKDSAPGEDGNPYTFITQLNYFSKTHFLKILNCIYANGIIPESGKS